MKAKSTFLLTILAGVFCVSLVVSNIIAGKLWQAPFGIVLTCGVFLFPIVYIIGDVVPECYGLATARRVIWLGFITNLLAVLMFVLTLFANAPVFWQGQEAFNTVLGFTPRLLFASFIAYLVGTNVNAWVLVRVKALTKSRYLWVRTITSTICGEAVDSTIFIILAFGGILPWGVIPGMILAQTLFKTGYEVIATPLTYAVVAAVKRFEGIDPEAEKQVTPAVA